MGTRGSRGSAAQSPASGWEHLSVWGTGPWRALGVARSQVGGEHFSDQSQKLPIDAALRAPLSPAPPPPPKGEGEESRRGRRGGSPGPSSRRGARGRGRPGRGRREARGAPAPLPGAQPAPGPDRRRTDPGTWLEFSAIKVHLVGVRPPLLQVRGESAARGSPRGSGRSWCASPTLRAPCKPRGSERRLGTGQREQAGRAEAPACPLPFSTFPLPAETGGGGRGPSPGGARCRRGEAESLAHRLAARGEGPGSPPTGGAPPGRVLSHWLGPPSGRPTGAGTVAGYRRAPPDRTRRAGKGMQAVSWLPFHRAPLTPKKEQDGW